MRRRFADGWLLFDVSLDLTPFVSGEGTLTDINTEKLQYYLGTPNDLEVLVLKRFVEWECWEDIATNIRQRLRTLGFMGNLQIFLDSSDEVLVRKNCKWSNFVHNQATKVLVALSVVGVFFWVPYLMIRAKRVEVDSRFQISIAVDRYWNLISDGLNRADGYQTD